MTKIIKPDDFVSLDGTEDGMPGKKLLELFNLDADKCKIIVDEDGCLVITQEDIDFSHTTAPYLWKRVGNRVIIATLVHNVEALTDVKHIKLCTMSFMGAAWNEALPKNLKVTVIAEGEEREPISTDNFVFGYGSTEKFEIGIAGIEEPGGKRDGDGQPPEPNVMFGIGSVEYCQAFVHFWATSSDDCISNWGLHMLRRLTNCEPGTVWWYDSKDERLSFGSIAEMFSFMKEAVAG